MVDDIIGDNEEEGQYYNIIFTHPQFLTAASSKVRVNRVALSPSPTAVCSLEVVKVIISTGNDNNFQAEVAIN